MRRIFLIRHGLPEFPEGKKMCLGITDLPLAAEGRVQAAEMAARLPPVAAVFSSPLLRAVETAQAIGAPVTVLEGLRELDMGCWDGLTFDEIRRRDPELYEQRGEDPNLLPEGAEDPQNGLLRFRTALEQAVQSSSGDLAVVAHAGVMGAFLQELTGKKRKPGYCEWVLICWEDGVFWVQEEENNA